MEGKSEGAEERAETGLGLHHPASRLPERLRKDAAGCDPSRTRLCCL